MLASRLVTVAACGRSDAYCRLARIVTRVLVSVKLRQREKWRSLAFQRVRELCGDHPTLAVFLEDLVPMELCLRPTLDGSINSFRCNVEDALSSVYRHAFDLKRNILSPAASGSQPPVFPDLGTVAKRSRAGAGST